MTSTEKRDQCNPFFLRLEPKGRNTGRSASACLEFRPICEECGTDLDSKEYLIRPISKPPNFKCPKCGKKTEYTLKQMLDAIDDFHERYPTEELHRRGIYRLDFVRDELNYLDNRKPDYLQ